MKMILNYLLNLFGFIWNIIPTILRREIFTFFLILESRSINVKSGLKNLFHFRDRLDWIINERAMKYGKGVHPKHKLTGYHNFFINRIEDGENVLDVGCGYGAVAKNIAISKPNSKVVGIDNDRKRLSQALNIDKLNNLEFVFGDATSSVPEGKWSIVILSNVLEHIIERKKFLLDLCLTTSAKKFLIRVPLFERDWQMALRKEIKVNYFSDNDHKIEHKIDEFKKEVIESNLEIIELKTIWGEIWSECRPLIS